MLVPPSGARKRTHVSVPGALSSRRVASKDAFFHRDGDAFVATELTRGPWSPDHQHGGPPAALLGRAIESCEPRAGSRISRITFEILRPIPIDRFEVAVRMARPGRSVELLEAELSHGGEPVMLARAWRIRTQADVAPEVLADADPPAAPGGAAETPFFPGAPPVGYHSAMEVRFVEGRWTEQGPAAAWFRIRGTLVAGEPLSPLTRVLAAADSANGISASLDFGKHLFINPDLTVQLHRYPEGEWVCLDAVTRIAPDGIGSSDAALWDERGRIGRVAQSLFVSGR